MRDQWNDYRAMSLPVRLLIGVPVVLLAAIILLAVLLFALLYATPNRQGERMRSIATVEAPTPTR